VGNVINVTETTCRSGNTRIEVASCFVDFQIASRKDVDHQNGKNVVEGHLTNPPRSQIPSCVTYHDLPNPSKQFCSGLSGGLGGDIHSVGFVAC
jgi:hypothetical protein